MGRCRFFRQKSPLVILSSRMKNHYDYDDDDELFEHHRLIVDPGQTLTRVDKYVTHKIPSVSRNRVQNALKAGFILVNKEPVKANYKVHPHDEIVVNLPEPPRETDVIPQDIPLNIVHEDEHLMLINKPAGLVMHPATENWTGTLVNGVLFYLQNKGQQFPGLVHRIDKDTTGLVVLPKTEETKLALSEQFFHHSIERTYYALVWGQVKEDKGTIRANLARSPKDRRVMKAYEDEEIGKHAVTHYEVLERYRYVTLVKCNLETGRTHQIRAHFRYLGHPLFSDSRYGGNRILKGSIYSKYRSFIKNCFKAIPRQALHAKSLGFLHPGTGEHVQFESELPDDFKHVLEKWENYVHYM